MLRKKLCRLLCCIAILCLTATSVFAYGYYDGPIVTGSIRFDFSTEEGDFPGGTVDLRMVARYDEDAKLLVWCDGYDALGLDLYTDLDENGTAAQLFLYAEMNGLPAQSVTVAADGTAKVEDLPIGTYLVSQITPFDGFYCIAPALISVPLEVDGEWIFDVDAAPKLSPMVEETTETVPTTTEPPDLPPTGQVNWPIPLLVLGGSFLIILGVCLRKDKRNETDT